MALSEKTLRRLTMNPPLLFSYSAETGDFLVGERRVPFADYPDHEPPMPDAITPEAAEELVKGSALLLGFFGRLYQTPRLTAWLLSMGDGPERQVQTAVTDVMIDVYTEVSGQKPYKSSGDDPWSFNLSFVRAGHPQLSVLGNCACMGVSPDGLIFGRDSWDEGFAEYQQHNIDTDAQNIAIMAGAGTLASLALADS